MAWSSKKKAFVFAAGLLLVSTIMVGTAVATTGSTLSPFLRGSEFAGERSLTRGEHVALAVRVGQEVGDDLKPLQGATVAVARSDAADLVLAKQTTGPRGGAVFELKPGKYQVTVSKDSLVATHEIVLRQSERLGVLFDSSGQATWQEAAHGDLERRGDTYGLIVKVGRNESGQRVPVANATVQIYRYTDRTHTEYVGEMLTGPRGVAGFQLHKGYYLVKVLADGASGEHNLTMKGPTTMGVLIDGSTMHWRVAEGATPSPRPRAAR